jgi:arsenate reductase (thioredoxin)
LSRTILFVCVGNSGRSQMAEAIFNKLKPEGFRAISAGTKPAEDVNPLIVQVLREIGIDASNARPKPISPEMITEAERIITMGCEASDFCPARFLSRVEDWNIEDAKGKTLDEIRSIRDSIHERVGELLQRLQSN